MIIPFDGVWPRVAPDAFVAPSATLIGDVEIGPGASVWFGAVLRGDVGPIRVGRRTNLQDGVIVHLDAGLPAILGDDVTVGHGAIVHGAIVEHGAQIGMGAIVLSGARIGAGSMVAAGAVVPEGMEVPAGTLAMGVPARTRRDITDEERRALLERAAAYAGRGAIYRRTIDGLPETT